MKKSFLSTLMAGLAVVAFTFTSCTTDPCKDVTCDNGGECVEGDCVCATGYEGTTCQTEMRTKFLGAFLANETGVVDYACTVSTSSTGINKIVITGFGGYACGGSDIAVICTVDGTDLTVDADQSFCAGQIVIDSGSGSINASGNVITITYSTGGAQYTTTYTRP